MSRATQILLGRTTLKLVLPAILILGFLVRLRMAILAFFVEFDTATVGLMGVHILKGVSRPLFFYGQSYMGALEAYLAALMFSLFGVSNVSLSLSPVLFAVLWIAASYYLFKELFGRKGAIAAALCVAVPGWYAQWFTLAAHGGYPGAFFFGTCFLWLAVRIYKHDLSSLSIWLHAAGMGLCAALGVWTNLQVLSYLACAAFVLLLSLRRRGINRNIIIALAFAAIISSLGFIPVLLVTGEVAFDSMTTDTPSLKLIPGNLRVMWKTMPRLFTWPVTRDFVAVNVIVLGSLATLGFLYIWRTISGFVRRRECDGWIPLFFAFAFLALYLPHPMAGLGAPRYLIPVTTVLVCATFASGVTSRIRAFQYFSWLSLILWLALNLVSGEITSRAKAPRKQARCAEDKEIVELVEEAGLENITVIGSDIDGLSGQVLSFFAEANLRFVSSYYERYDPSAQIAEQDPDMGFMCSRRHFGKVSKNFAAAGITDYEVIQCGEMIMHSISVPCVKELSVPLADMKIEIDGPVTGEPFFAIDQCADTTLAFAHRKDGPATCSLLIDLQTPAQIGCLWLTSKDSKLLPGACQVSTSTNGNDYVRCGGIERALHAYADGNKAYIMGHYARTEIRFEPVAARYIKIDLVSQRRWEINELRVFQWIEQGSPVSEEEVDTMADAIVDKGIDFTVSDRWLSAQLMTRLPSNNKRPPVYPRFNPRYSYTRIARTIRPRNGLAIAIAARLADETEMFLHNSLKGHVELSRTDFSHYSLFTFSVPDPEPQNLPLLYWNGHLLLR